MDCLADGDVPVYYSRNVLHQKLFDVKLNNILVDGGCLKVADFANAVMFGVDAGMEEICARDPLSRVGILGLGCVFYSIAAWRVFFCYDYFGHERWPRLEELPETRGLLCEDIINKCWRDSYGTLG